MTDAFDDQPGDQDDQGHDDSQVAFETKAIFTLADFLKTLSANEYYDIAQKVYNEWAEQDLKQPINKLEPLVKIYARHSQARVSSAFAQWKQLNCFADLVEENEKLREYMQMLVQENQQLSSERNILELQTKKRNQNNAANIQPLRHGRRNSAMAGSASLKTGQGSYRSSSRTPLNNQLFDQSGIPIHERLHKESYQKSQKHIVNDVIKQREELRDCTFRPATSSQLLTPSNFNVRREDPLLFERLSKSTKKFNPELLQLQRESEELNLCTFQPLTNKKSKDIAESQGIYADKNQFYERLHKEADNKNQYMRSLQLLKENSEVNQCTFHPETNSSLKDSQMSQSRREGSSNGDDTFKRLHSDYERNLRSKVKVETEYDQKFKESHPFQPTRVTKEKDGKYVGDRKENSQQRASRLYESYKDREQKIAAKKKELLKEEEKLHRITCKPSRKPAQKQSLDHSTNESQVQSSRSQVSPDQQPNNITQVAASAQSYIDLLYAKGKDKAKRQEELRSKLYKEQGINFAPQTNVGKYNQIFENKNVIDRTNEFLQKRDSHIKELKQSTACDFKPQRVTSQSKLSKQYEREVVNNENWGDKLYAKASEFEQRKERIRQEHSQDRNCTFKPVLAKGTDRILKGSHSKSSFSHSASQHSLGGNPAPAYEGSRRPFAEKSVIN